MAILHITNGDGAARTLRQIVPGPVTITADVLHEGPAPEIDGPAWRDVRARYLSTAGYAPYEQILEAYDAWDRAIEEAGAYDEIVLWFEHDLFDQLLLIRTLSLLTPTGRVGLVCVGSFPGVARFIGLGQLTGEQMATLVDTDRPVTPEQFAIARETWSAFRAADPTALLDAAVRLQSDSGRHAFAFLGDALIRLFEEYPSAANGLARSEENVLRAVAQGPLTGMELFPRTQAQEARPFQGDSSCFRVIRDLAAARVPLVAIEQDPGALDLARHRVWLTDAGREVLDAQQDAVVTNGIDRWIGGVHLDGRGAGRWRWDRERKTLVS